MHATYLSHSGFLVETATCYLLFDWWQGDLPAMADKPLYIFASHSHHDHFIPEIFTLKGTCILSDDISLVSREHVHLVKGNQTLTVDNLTIQTLPSTDEGVAFLVTVDGKTIYHAGDLNWWHWEGEPDPWNPQMEKDFKQYIAPLTGRTIDLAMVPLDGRLGAAASWGLRHLLEIATVHTVIPMHQWNDPAPTQDFVAQYPQWANKIRPLEVSGASLQV
ncbi:MBL fold metallo-hydrolase [Bengtsoniella intestinalis]|uniref:MBL fold metallo-hydrolase n=1 Tax=Bengtsoniella intestinalis TaxID=3073143 RepID=UPI00391FA279